MLSNLKTLHIHNHQSTNIFLEDFQTLVQLHSLSLIGQQDQQMRVYGSLQTLPAGITSLQLNHCLARPLQRHKLHTQLFYTGFHLQDLAHIHKLARLDFAYCRITFGEGCVKAADLQHIKVIVLEGAQASRPQALIASLSTATQLQDLNLARVQLDSIGGLKPVIRLGQLLASLHSLQKLDVTSCSHVRLRPSEYTQLRLHSFACHYNQLNLVEAIPITKPSHNRFKPGKAVQSRLACKWWDTFRDLDTIIGWTCCL